MNRKAVVLFCLLLSGFANRANAQELEKIETYKAAPYPASEYIDKETYDYRAASNAANPPTLTDAFTCDIWQRIDRSDMPLSEVKTKQVTAALKVYLTKDYRKIAGYRPWTHWNFIRSLTKEQRKILAGEVTEYIRKNGVDCPD